MQLETTSRLLITGGAGGIAGAVAEVFAQAGARLALSDVAADRLHQRATSLDAVPVVADLTDPQQARTMVETAASELGGLDGVIHTTGGFGMAPATDDDPQLVDRMLDLNIRTLITTTAAALPRLLAADSGFLAGFSAGPGWLRHGGGGMAVYAAAKAAVAAYIHAVQDEHEGDGLRTAVVYPMGVVDTPANRDAMPDDDRSQWIDPAEIGAALLFAVTRGARGRVSELPVFPAGG